MLFPIILVPYGVSIFLFRPYGFSVGFRRGNILVPYGVSIFLFTIYAAKDSYSKRSILVPYGVSIFLFCEDHIIMGKSKDSRPLWGIYISIQFSIYFSHNINLILVPYGVSIFLFTLSKIYIIIY